MAEEYRAVKKSESANKNRICLDKNRIAFSLNFFFN